MTRFVLHPDTFKDLEEIGEFIAADSLNAADEVIGEIYDSITSLVSFPLSGHLRPDLTSKPLRFHRVHDFLIAYAPAEIPLLVVGVIHGRRNPRVIAAVLRERK
jgi:plasmid stabilization system protein ParE